MPFAAAFKDALLQAVVVDNLSLHSGNPGSTGLLELTNTGSPAYARKAATWAASSGGSKALAATFPIFDVYSGATVAAVGLWKSGVYYGYVTVSSETFSAQGTYTITSGSIDLNATASA